MAFALRFSEELRAWDRHRRETAAMMEAAWQAAAVTVAVRRTAAGLAE